MFGILNNQFKRLIQDDKHIFVVNIIINDISLIWGMRRRQSASAEDEEVVKYLEQSI